MQFNCKIKFSKFIKILLTSEVHQSQAQGVLQVMDQPFTWQGASGAGATALGEVGLFVRNCFHFVVVCSAWFRPPHVNGFSRSDEPVSPSVGHVVGGAGFAIGVDVAVAAVGHSIRSTDFVVELTAFVNFVAVNILSCKFLHVRFQILFA